MFIYHTNSHTGITYKYDHDEYDIFTPMFDRTLHDDNIDIDPQWYYPKTCAYCDTTFPSRNKLFYHLGFMNIQTRQSPGHEGYKSRKRKNKRKSRGWLSVRKKFAIKKKNSQRQQQLCELLTQLCV